MAGKTALFVARDASNNGTTPVGARLALGGLLAGNGASPLDVRAGVLVDSGGAIVSGTANMSYDVRAFRAVSRVSTANGPTIGANDASVNVVTTAAPGSNSRIDTIWARQHLVTGDGDVDSDVIYQIGVTQGTVAASPAAPTIPVGAVALYHATVTAGVAATSGLVFTRAHAWTVANGGVIPVTSSTERTAITPYEGLAIWYTPTDELQLWDGAAWKIVGANQANPVAVYALASTVNIVNITDTTITTWAARSPHNQQGTGFFSFAAGVLTCTKAGMYRVTSQIKWESESGGYREIRILLSGANVSSSRIEPSSTNGQSSVITQVLSLTAGQTLAIQVRVSGTGAGTNAEGSATELLSSFTTEYLGTPAV